MSNGYLSLLLLAIYIGECSPQPPPTYSTGVFRLPAVGNSPRAPPAFPDWNKLFSGFNELIEGAKNRTRDNNITTTFCPVKINMTYFNERLKTSCPLDVNPICDPTSPPTCPPTTTTPTTSVVPSTATTTVRRTASQTVVASLTQTLHSTMTSSAGAQTNSPISDVSTRVERAATGHVMSQETPRVAPDRQPSTASPPPAGVELVQVAVPVALVSVACIALVIIICCSRRICGKNQPVNCKDILMSRLRRNNGKPTTNYYVPGCVNTTEVDIKKACRTTKAIKLNGKSNGVATETAEDGMADTMTSHSVRKTQPVRADSTISTIYLIRSDSRPPGESQTDDFLPVESTQEMFARKCSFTPVLEGVGEFMEPVPRGSRKTDPIHRRLFADAEWQRTLPSASTRASRVHPFDVTPATNVSSGPIAQDNLIKDLHSKGVDNLSFQSHNEVKTEKTQTENDEDDDELTRSAWETFDKAENMAIEVEMGSQLIGDVLNAHVELTSPAPVQAAVLNETLVELI